ncbi:MAG TPA: DUF2878 domain-containing protein [Pseudoxanthomonas sp.]|nr:DUF2878 domain-containing protein [Pseudoxanthomonas sp.]
MNNWLNFIGSQLLWMAAVGGAAHGHAWMGPLAFVLFAALQLSPRFRAHRDASLMLLALPVGMAVDTIMAASGLLRYAAPLPHPQVAPIWILALWMGFALTFNHSLAYVIRRPLLAIAFGALGGPFSYWIASRTWGAVHFTDSLPSVLLPLGALWGAAMGLFSYATLRLTRTPLPSSSGVPG